MAYQYHGTTNLIPLPNRTVQTYPSGLVRVERSFACRKAQGSAYRGALKVGNLMPTDNGAPAVDGIYIFPEPQEISRDDGFVEFRVSAYGRANFTGQCTRVPFSSTATVSALAEFYNQYYNPSDPSSNQVQLYSYKESLGEIEGYNLLMSICLPTTDREIPVAPQELISAQLKSSGQDLYDLRLSAEEIWPFLAGMTQSGLVNASSQLRSFSRQTTAVVVERKNFGKFDEVLISFTQRNPNLDFGMFYNTNATPSRPVLNGILVQSNLVKIDFSAPENSTGVTYQVGANPPIYLPYNTGDLTKTNAYASLGIRGLSPNTNYTATIQATNNNGSSAALALSFRTADFIG